MKTLYTARKFWQPLVILFLVLFGSIWLFTHQKHALAQADPLGGYNILIADRGNNRLVEVSPNKQVLWQYDFQGYPAGFAADDSFFIHGGSQIIANIEKENLIDIIDKASSSIVWQYGGDLKTPDDAYMLSNGDIITADIGNCRIVEISPDKKVVRQYGHAGHCDLAPGDLDSPNGDTPLPNGNLLVTNLGSRVLVELDPNWHEISRVKLPVRFPSDAHLMQDGNILVAGYTNPGVIAEVNWQGEIVWQYDQGLNKPSIAVELPNGNILATDDYNNRVIVLDKKTSKIVWEYDGVNIPDGVDIIKA